MDAKVTNNVQVELLGHHGSDFRIAQKAWASSNKAEGRTLEDAQRLVRFLYRERHLPPFYSGGFAFRIKASYRTLVQIARHTTLVPNQPCEVGDVFDSVCQSSARYGVVLDELYVDKVLNNKQLFKDLFQDNWVEMYDTVSKLLLNSLENLELWDKMNEQLKGKQNPIRDALNSFLPQGAVTYLDVDINLWSFRNFLERRLSKHAQSDIRLIAYGMLEEVRRLPEYAVFVELIEMDLMGHIISVEDDLLGG